MPEQSVIGIYDTMSKAEQAVRQLDREGFPIQQVSIIGHDSERELEEHLRAGKYLLIAHGSAEDVERAHQLLHRSGAEELNLHVQPQPSRE